MKGQLTKCFKLPEQVLNFQILNNRKCGYVLLLLVGLSPQFDRKIEISKLLVVAVIEAYIMRYDYGVK